MPVTFTITDTYLNRWCKHAVQHAVTAYVSRQVDTTSFIGRLCSIENNVRQLLEEENLLLIIEFNPGGANYSITEIRSSLKNLDENLSVKSVMRRCGVHKVEFEY